MRDGAAAAPKNLDIICAFFAQKIDNGSEKFDVPTVITRDANGPHVLLDGSANDVANRAVIAEVNDFDAVPDEFKIDRVDRTIVAITNRHCGQNSNRRRHFFQELTTNLESRKTGKLTKYLSACFFVSWFSVFVSKLRHNRMKTPSRFAQSSLQVWSSVCWTFLPRS
jgi:hypothetical protein